MLRWGRYQSSLLRPRRRPPRPLETNRSSLMSHRRLHRRQVPVVRAHVRKHPNRNPTSNRVRSCEPDRLSAHLPPPNHLDPACSRRLCEKNGNQVETTTTKEHSTRGRKCTITNGKSRLEEDHIKETQVLIRGLINPGGCCRRENELSPTALLLFVYKR